MKKVYSFLLCICFIPLSVYATCSESEQLEVISHTKMSVALDEYLQGSSLQFLSTAGKVEVTGVVDNVVAKQQVIYYIQSQNSKHCQIIQSIAVKQPVINPKEISNEISLAAKSRLATYPDKLALPINLPNIHYHKGILTLSGTLTASEKDTINQILQSIPFVTAIKFK